MSDQRAKRAFGLEDLRVLSLQVQSGVPAEDQDTSLIEWTATYYEPERVDDHRVGRIVIGQLHAHASDGFGTVAVGGVFTDFQEIPEDEAELARFIADSLALETLYDFARVTFRTVAGLGDVHFELPFHSPTPEVVKGGEGELVVTKNPALTMSTTDAATTSSADGAN